MEEKKNMKRVHGFDACVIVLSAILLWQIEIFMYTEVLLKQTMQTQPSLLKRIFFSICKDFYLQFKIIRLLLLIYLYVRSNGF